MKGCMNTDLGIITIDSEGRPGSFTEEGESYERNSGVDI